MGISWLYNDQYIIDDRFTYNVFPQPPKRMGSSAQNSSGVHWCRRRVRFNDVPEKAPKVPKKVWEALVQSQVRFIRICGHLIHGSPAGVFPALGLATRFRKNKTSRLLGIPPKLIFICSKPWKNDGAHGCTIFRHTPNEVFACGKRA
jgi:hypothetical protein